MGQFFFLRLFNLFVYPLEQLSFLYQSMSLAILTSHSVCHTMGIQYMSDEWLRKWINAFLNFHMLGLW